MQKVAIFPGSFDPFHVGHETIVRRALSLFDVIIIAIGINTNKKEYFPPEIRLSWITEVFKDTPGVEVASYNGLTVDYCKSVGAKFILRGLRTASDFEYERAIAQVNKTMETEIESVFFLTTPEYTPVNSSIVRDILRHGGDARKFLAGNDKVKEEITKYLIQDEK